MPTHQCLKNKFTLQKKKKKIHQSKPNYYTERTYSSPRLPKTSGILYKHKHILPAMIYMHISLSTKGTQERVRCFKRS